MKFKEIFEKLPFRLGSDMWENRLKEALEKNEEAIEVNCLGTDKYELLDGKRVKVFNEKVGSWQIYDITEYKDICGVCGKLMLVRAIKGTTWFALCSKECYET